MKKLKTFLQKWYAVLLIILLSILAYGLMIPWLKLYWDDWVFTWVYQTFGSNGLFIYFSSKRPVWGLIYQVTMHFLSDHILLWHLFGLFWRILTSLAFYWLMVLLWPKKKGLTLAAGLLFAVYPGFLLQTVALCFGHFWLIDLIFLVSNCLTVLAIRFPAKRLGYTIAAVVLSIINMLCMEYFLPLEVIRLVFLFFLVTEPLPFFKRLLTAIKLWLPYLGALILVLFYRIFFFKAQTHNYSLGLLDTFRQNFLTGTAQLFNEVITALYQSAVYAWAKPFIELITRFSANRTFLALVAFTLMVFVGLAFILLRVFRTHTKSEENRWQISPLVVAILALLLAGIPFYVTLLPVDTFTTDSRFTLPFMLGAALLLAYLLDLIHVRWLKVGLLSLIVAAAVGFNLLNENDFRLMSIHNNELMYELFWRAPNLKPGTLLVTNEESQYFTFNTLKAELNLITFQGKDDTYGWVFGRDLAALVTTPMQANTQISIPADLVKFSGNGSSVAAFQLNGDGCLRFIDKNSSFIPKDLLTYSFQNISNPENLVNDSGYSLRLNKKLIGPEPAHGWCYYFEKSDLALQNKDYATIQANYQKVIEKSLSPHEGYEWFPYIEGLAGAGDWKTALALAQQVIAKNPPKLTVDGLPTDSYPVAICRALQPLVTQAQDPAEAASALSSLNCTK